jgi:hypothetical protein
MKSHHSLLAAGSVLAGAFFALNATAQLSYNVSGDPNGNSSGVFSDFDPQTPWNSGDIVLPTATTIDTSPLEIDLTLSDNVTLNNSGHYSWALNYDSSTPIAENSDLGSLYFVLLENGTPITTQIGFDAGANGFGEPVTQFATGDYDDSLDNAVFNGVQIFVSNDNPETLDDVEISVDAAPVPEPNTFALLSLGLVAMAGFGYRKVNAIRSKL